MSQFPPILKNKMHSIQEKSGLLITCDESIKEFIVDKGRSDFIVLEELDDRNLIIFEDKYKDIMEAVWKLHTDTTYHEKVEL